MYLRCQREFCQDVSSGLGSNQKCAFFPLFVYHAMPCIFWIVRTVPMQDHNKDFSRGFFFQILREMKLLVTNTRHWMGIENASYGSTFWHSSIRWHSSIHCISVFAGLRRLKVYYYYNYIYQCGQQTTIYGHARLKSLPSNPPPPPLNNVHSSKAREYC